MKDVPTQGIDKSTFSNRRPSYPRYGKVEFFNSRLTKLLLRMQ